MMAHALYIEAVLATAGGIWSLIGWHYADRRAAKAEAKVFELDMEVQNRISDITNLSSQITILERKRLAKPGPGRRVEVAARIAARAAELRSGIIA